MQLKEPQRQEQTQEHIKRCGQARLVYVKDIKRNIPTTWRSARGLIYIDKQLENVKHIHNNGRPQSQWLVAPFYTIWHRYTSYFLELLNFLTWVYISSSARYLAWATCRRQELYKNWCHKVTETRNASPIILIASAMISLWCWWRPCNIASSPYWLIARLFHATSGS